MKDDVYQALRRGGAPKGFALGEPERGEIIVRYPGVPDSWADPAPEPGARPGLTGPPLNACCAILVAAGYQVEVIRGGTARALLVTRPR